MTITENLSLATDVKSDDQCYYTVGVHRVRSPTRKSFRTIWQNKMLFVPENSDMSSVDNEQSKTFANDSPHPPSTPLALAHHPAWKAQYNFCKFGIDKPLLDSDDSFNKTSTPVNNSPKVQRQLSPLLTAEEKSQSKLAIERQVRAFFLPSKNRKGCLKVSPGDRADDTSAQHSWVIHPSSNIRHNWDFLMVGLILITLVEAPLNVAFFPELLDPTELLLLNVVLDLFFAVDIFLNFWTGFYDKGTVMKTLILKPELIRHNYLKGWFGVDLISTIPFDYTILPILHFITYFDIPKDGCLVQVVKFLALLRTLRICRLYRYLPRCQKAMYAQSWMYVRVLNLALMMVIVSHWNGCIQFLVNYCLGFPPKCWISLAGIQNAPWWEQWSWSLFNAVSQTFGISFGKNTPETLTDLWFTIWGMVTGTSGYALILANIATMWQHVDASRKLHRLKMQEVEDYMAFRRFPHKLRVRVRDYFEQRYRGHVFDEDRILNTLSEPLKELVMRHNCEETVRSVPFFAKTETAFVNELITRLRFSFFQPGDIIANFGTLGSNMFFIQSGKVTVANEDGKVLTTLEAGMYFGELSLIVSCKRNASVRAKTHCSLLELTSDDFHQVLKKFPLIDQAIKCLASDILSNPITKRDSVSYIDEQDTVTSLGTFIPF